MTTQVSRLSGMFGTARGLSAGVGLLVSAAVVCLIGAALLPDLSQRLAALVAGLTLIAMVLLVKGLAAAGSWRLHQLDRRIEVLVGQDASPCFATDELGQIGYRNAAATHRFALREGGTLAAALAGQFANPGAVLFRLQARAQAAGVAREDVISRNGHLRLSVHIVAPGRFLWRMEEFQDRDGAGRGAESLSLPMLVANRAGVVLYCNDAARRLIGLRPKRLDQVFPAAVPLRHGEEIAVNGAEGPVRAILAEIEGVGERREIYLLPVADEAGRPPVAADFEHLPVALMRFTTHGALVAANRAARDLVPLGPDDGAMFHTLFEGLGRPVSDWLADVAAGRMPGGSEVLRSRHCDNDCFLQVTLSRVVEFGRPGILAVIADATQLKRLEAQFTQSQKMQAIGQLAGGVAHDFNNLLTAISGHCDLLLLRHGREDPEYADLVQIHQNANRAAALVGQLLAFSRKQTLKPERLDLQEVLSDLSHLLKRLVGERVAIRVAHGTGLGEIRADKRQLEQVLMNLVVNARDAMPEGGTIRIETAALHLAAPLARDRATVPPGDYTLIRVADTGCGIPADRLQKIFEPFFTTKRTGEGTGLGLSTAYGIVKQSGGFIFVDSIVGQGSEFTLYFPVHSTPAEDPAPAAPAARRMVMKQGEGVVLLVEDEAPVRAFASRALRMRGYTVLEAENAEEALRTLADPALEVDVFVTDVVMPGIDGPTWVREALKTRPNVRVIFVSGYAEDCLSENQARIPNSVFLAKPFSLTDLTATVQGQLH